MDKDWPQLISRFCDKDQHMWTEWANSVNRENLPVDLTWQSLSGIYLNNFQSFIRFDNKTYPTHCFFEQKRVAQISHTKTAKHISCDQLRQCTGLCRQSVPLSHDNLPQKFTVVGKPACLSKWTEMRRSVPRPFHPRTEMAKHSYLICGVWPFRYMSTNLARHGHKQWKIIDIQNFWCHISGTAKFQMLSEGVWCSPNIQNFGCQWTSTAGTYVSPYQSGFPLRLTYKIPWFFQVFKVFSKYFLSFSVGFVYYLSKSKESTNWCFYLQYKFWTITCFGKAFFKII